MIYDNCKKLLGSLKATVRYQSLFRENALFRWNLLVIVTASKKVVLTV